MGCFFSFKYQLLLLLCCNCRVFGNTLLALVYEIIWLAADPSNSFSHSTEMLGEILLAEHCFTAFITSLAVFHLLKKGKKGVVSFESAYVSVCYSFFFKTKHSVSSGTLIGLL